MLYSIEASQRSSRLCRNDPRLVATQLQLTFWNVLPATCRFFVFLGSRSCLLKRPLSQVWLEESSYMSPISRERLLYVYTFLQTSPDPSLGTTPSLNSGAILLMSWLVSSRGLSGHTTDLLVQSHP